MEGDISLLSFKSCLEISIHALRVEGDMQQHFFLLVRLVDFYPRPPGGGRPRRQFPKLALPHDFYPRPPGGGRQGSVLYTGCPFLFLSTPSGWRATSGPYLRRPDRYNFYPRPPGGGRPTTRYSIPPVPLCISIHALRVEGDILRRQFIWQRQQFLSTPSGWRATWFSFRYWGLNFKFLSTPSGWRATAKTDKVFICFCAKGRRICLFKTRKEKNLPVAF